MRIAIRYYRIAFKQRYVDIAYIPEKFFKSAARNFWRQIGKDKLSPIILAAVRKISNCLDKNFIFDMLFETTI